MTQSIPIILSGNSLGERHRLLNSLVNDAHQSSVPIDSIQHLPEATPVDKLFKIDLASKYKKVDYIVKNLKEPDMLYVSRALKSTWLLEKEYENIINPQNLEHELFPEMTAKAANKMLHWIQHHLRDPDRCQNFYKYYKQIYFILAVKFLWHCSNEYILDEIINIIDKINPKDLKVISEKCPEATKIFYKQLEDNRNAISHYLNNETQFFKNLKFILLSDPETFFDVTERYFNKRFKHFSYAVTKYIMINHKNRFLGKPELYTARLLDMKALSESLNPEEVKDLVVKLARAEYLENWFSYQNVEPLIKRLEKNERVVFKKLIFVDKAFGDKIKHCPYNTPHPPVLKRIPGFNIFRDRENNYNITPVQYCLRSANMSLCKARKLPKCEMYKTKTLLDELFDKYRFVSFEETLCELRKRLRTESVPQNRQFIMLVLISKCGGKEQSLRILFELLMQYRNEPANLRAAIIRSLVKRACVWRMPPDLWSTLLVWGHGLGLDGSPPEAACDEGLHAVFLRELLAGKSPSPLILNSFLDKFTTFNDYSLNATERTFLHRCLPNLLLNVGDEVTVFNKIQRLHLLLDTLTAFEIPFNKCPGVVDAVTTAARENIQESCHLLDRLYKAKVGRRELFKENFIRHQNEQSYVNALRHDISILNAEGFEEILKNITGKSLRFDFFFRKLIVYFSGSGELAEQYYNILKGFASSKPNKWLGRSLAILAGEDLTSLLKSFDVDRKERRNKTPAQSLAAALRANAHESKPPLDVNAFGWQLVGAKAVANSISRSPKGKLEDIILKLITWKRTIRLALALTKNENTTFEIYNILATLRPGVALKLFLLTFKNEKNYGNIVSIWNVVKPLINGLDYKKRNRLHMKLQSIDDKTVPTIIRVEFFVLVYQAFTGPKTDTNKRDILRMLCYIANNCSEVDENFLFDNIINFFETKYFVDAVTAEQTYGNYNKLSQCSVYMSLIAKCLLLCNSEETQQKRLEAIATPFFALIEDLWKNPVYQMRLLRFVNDFLSALRYSKVFFSSKYVSCMPVFERVVEWMQTMLPIEKWFGMYIHIHLTMLYSKAARHCINKIPKYFSSEDVRDLNKAVEMFGVTFGKFVAHEYEELKEKYFQSIRKIYKCELLDYLSKYLVYFDYDESKEMFIIEFIKSILKEDKLNEAHFLAYYVFKTYKHYFKYGYDTTEIVKILQNTDNLELRICIDIDDEVRFTNEAESGSSSSPSSDQWSIYSD